MTAQEPAVIIITNAARKVLTEVQQRCGQALRALEQNDHLVALGAIVGLEEKVRSISARLMVLREIYEQKSKS